MRAALVALPLALLLLAAAGPGNRAPDPQEVAQGKQVFDLVCSGCHTIQPPPDSAPPMSHVARHLRQELGTLEAFTEHVRTYVPAPSPERSRLPAMAIERFGLMGALPMEDAVLENVAAYIWTLADSARGGMGGEMEMGRGQAGGHHGMGMGMKQGAGMSMEPGAGMGRGARMGPGMGMKRGADGTGLACGSPDGAAGDCHCRRAGAGGGR